MHTQNVLSNKDHHQGSIRQTDSTTYRLVCLPPDDLHQLKRSAVLLKNI